MKVKLSHCKNPDVRSGYWQPTFDPAKPQLVEVADIAAAARVCREYIERNQLGGGNWNGGKVTDNGKHVADISYNGRAWQPAPRGTLNRIEIKQADLMTAAELWQLPREERDKVLMA